MRRRLLLTALACWPAQQAFAQAGAQRPRHKMSAAQLHQALSARFPVRARLAGVLALEIGAPRLLLLPARNQLGAGLVATLSAPGEPQRTGEIDVAFRLRYEASDRSVRAHALEILAIRLPGVAPEFVQALERLAPLAAREAVGEVVLHRFSPRELAVPDTMGFVPEAFEVVDDGVWILFGPKPPAPAN